MDKKIGICTLFTGYNYGSALQAVATKEFLRQSGYEVDILKLSGSFVFGRDVRLKKLIIIGANLLFHLSNARSTISSYVGSKEKKVSVETKRLFDAFYKNVVCPVYVAERKMRALAKQKEYLAFVCGSDQIWNSTTYYVDPFYYLSFAPREKRVAFAPSFGRDFIPKYNQRRQKRRIREIPYLSVREESGKRLIYDMTGRSAEVLLDPSFLLAREAWIHLLDLQVPTCEQGYVLAYFLDNPSVKARQRLKQLSQKGYKIVALPYQRTGDWFDECVNAGPKEFLQHLLGAEHVCTDSFHGVAFSLNFEKSFYSFERVYTGVKQSTRVVSLLQKVGLMERHDAAHEAELATIDYGRCEVILEEEREKAKCFLLRSLQSVEKVLENSRDE